VSGSASPTVRVKKAFDYENPNERKFLILVSKPASSPGIIPFVTVLFVDTKNQDVKNPLFPVDYCSEY
jgi:hypothetical protein